MGNSQSISNIFENIRFSLVHNQAAYLHKKSKMSNGQIEVK